MFVLIPTFCFSKVENRMGFIFLLRNVWTIKNNNHIYSLDVVVGDKREIRPHNCLINQQWQQQTEWEKKTTSGWQYKHIQNNNTAIIRSGNWKRASVHNNKWMKENKRSEDKNENERRLFRICKKKISYLIANIFQIAKYFLFFEIMSLGKYFHICFN